MVNRAERRRAEKETKKPLGREEQELKDAEDELKSEIEEGDESLLDVFAAKLVIWATNDSQRTLAKEWYNLTFELKNENRRWVKEYSDAKKAMTFEEDGMIELMKQMKPDEVEIALTRRFPVISMGGVVGCSREFAAKLRERLDGKEPEDKQPSKEK